MSVLVLQVHVLTNSRDTAARCWQRGSSSFHRKNDRLSAFAILIAIFNHDSSLPTFTTTVATWAGHLRIVPVSVFRVETKNIVFMTYPMHNWVPYWLFTMVYACVPHFNLWGGHKHPCSFQLRIALNLKSTRHYMGLTWYLTSSPARAQSIIAKYKRYFLQIVDYFAVLC